MSAAEFVVIDEPGQPDAPSLLAAYMVADGYTGAEVQSYMDSHLPTPSLTNEQREDLADTLFEALMGVFDLDEVDAARESDELRDATVSWLVRQGLVSDGAA